MESRGGVTGGSTLTDFLSGYASEGYDGSFFVRRDGSLECSACERRLDPREVRMMSLRRVEGVSDPADMSAIAALECPSCGRRGTATFCFGPNCPPEDGLVLRALDNQRPSHLSQADVRQDASLVSDTGWITAPRDR